MISEIAHSPLGHNLFYIATGMLIAFVGSWLAVNVHVKAAASCGDRRSLMLVVAGFCLGCTAWTSHYVWMLGVTYPFLHSYELDGVVLSLVVAVATSCLGLYIASVRGKPVLRLIGGLVVGAGIGVMHFLGMVSLNFGGTRVFDLWFVAAAFGAGTLLTVLAMISQSVLRTSHPKMTMAAMLGVAIFVLHYVGMASITFQFDITVQPESSVDDRDLVFAVIFVAFSIMGMASVAFAVDTRSSGQKLRDMEHRAFHDNLTGLPNRAMLEDTLGIITKIATPGKSLVIVNFDLNRFKDINDVHGHAAGDQVLVTVAHRLKNALRSGEFLCRVGGDEFVAFKRAVQTKQEAGEFALRLRAAITPDIEWNDKRLSVGSSLGLARYPDDGKDIRELLVKADLAMYRAKRDRSGIPVFYSKELDDENMDKSALSIDLREAIAQGQLMLVYQRQNAIEDGSLVGYEVLTRWNHPLKGPVGPDVFIPLAERDGVINDIGEWVLRKACREAASWKTSTKIAVNVAARQIAHDGFPNVVRSALQESGLEPSLLEIEITESGIIADAVQALKIVKEIKGMGVAIVMDDFGTGYSSLSTLQSFPFDKIKIDKGFIKDVSVSRQSQAIVKSTIVLANALEIAVLAEGVETEADLEFLRKEGCRQVQGFLFGQPLTAAEVATA
jgi:diguanylate cyclase (GGDEF)-like protein